jgi:hypothetical protein
MLFHVLVPFIYSAFFFFSFPGGVINFGLFVIGVLIGFQILFADRIVHAFYLYPETEFNTLVRELWKRGDVKGMLKALAQAETLQEKLLTRSALFLIVYIFMTIFVLTSTGSVVGFGIMLGMGLHYTVDFWRYSKDPKKFAKQYLWQVKRVLSPQEIRAFVLGWTALFILLSLVIIF